MLILHLLHIGSLLKVLRVTASEAHLVSVHTRPRDSVSQNRRALRRWTLDGIVHGREHENPWSSRAKEHD
jgi:hypothetical protein